MAISSPIRFCMNTNRKHFLLLYFMLIISLSAVAQTEDDVSAGSARQTEKFADDYTESLLSGKTAVLGEYFGDSSRLMPEYQLTVIGKENSLHYYQSFLARFKVTAYKRKSVEILNLGKKIVELGTFELSLTVKSSQKNHIIKGKFFETWDRLPGGRLVLEAQAWNYSHNVEIVEQLRFSDVPATNVALLPHSPIANNVSFELAALNGFKERIISNHEPALWADFFTGDAKYIYSNNPVISGKKDIAVFLAEHCRHLPVFEKLDIRNDKISHLGKFIIEYASHIAVVRTETYSGVFTGKSITIWRRETDGSLKIFREMAMYD